MQHRYYQTTLFTKIFMKIKVYMFWGQKVTNWIIYVRGGGGRGMVLEVRRAFLKATEKCCIFPDLVAETFVNTLFWQRDKHLELKIEFFFQNFVELYNKVTNFSHCENHQLIVSFSFNRFYPRFLLQASYSGQVQKALVKTQFQSNPLTGHSIFF